MEFACKVAGSKVVLSWATPLRRYQGCIDGVQLGNLTALLAKIRPPLKPLSTRGALANKLRLRNPGGRKNVSMNIPTFAKRALCFGLESIGSIKMQARCTTSKRESLVSRVAL